MRAVEEAPISLRMGLKSDYVKWNAYVGASRRMNREVIVRSTWGWLFSVNSLLSKLTGRLDWGLRACSLKPRYYAAQVFIFAFREVLRLLSRYILGSPLVPISSLLPRLALGSTWLLFDRRCFSWSMLFKVEVYIKVYSQYDPLIETRVPDVVHVAANTGLRILILTSTGLYHHLHLHHLDHLHRYGLDYRLCE